MVDTGFSRIDVYKRQKEQCTTYTRYNAAAVTKSLMRIMDNAQQVNRNIGYEGSAVDEERLRFYAQEQRLTGIILLDTDGSVQCEYNGDLLNFQTLQKYIERIREIKIEDLLGRPEIKISLDEIRANFREKTVMVTGAAGSF